VHAAILRHQVREFQCRHAQQTCLHPPIGLHVIADGAVLLSTDAAARYGSQLTASQASGAMSLLLLIACCPHVCTCW
jgi:hypothetical protein